MLIEIDPTTFADALDKVRGLLPSSTTLDVLRHVRLEVVDGAVQVTATNLDTTIQTTCEATIHSGGGACLSGASLYDAVRQLDDGPLTIEIEDNYWANLTEPSIDVRIVGAHPDDYPAVPSTDAKDWTGVPASTLAAMIDKVEHAISTDDARANLTGAYLEADPYLQMTATDGHRLSRVERDVEAPGFLVDEGGVIVPRTALVELAGLLDDGYVEIGLNDDDQFVARYGDTVMVTRLIEGTFPDYTKVIPDDGAGDPAYIERETMTDRVKFVSMFASSKTNSIRLTLEDNELELYASDPDHGEGQRTVPVDYDGDEVKVRFNHRYLRDAIERVDSDTVELTSTDTVSPTLIEDPNDDEMLQVVMPMRL